MLWFAENFQLYAKSHGTQLMSMKSFLNLHQVTLFNKAQHQTGELDQPEVHPIFFQISPAFRQYTFGQI